MNFWGETDWSWGRDNGATLFNFVTSALNIKLHRAQKFTATLKYMMSNIWRYSHHIGCDQLKNKKGSEIRGKNRIKRFCDPDWSYSLENIDKLPQGVADIYIRLSFSWFSPLIEITVERDDFVDTFSSCSEQSARQVLRTGDDSIGKRTVTLGELEKWCLAETLKRLSAQKKKKKGLSYQFNNSSL